MHSTRTSFARMTRRLVVGGAAVAMVALGGCSSKAPTREAKSTATASSVVLHLIAYHPDTLDVPVDTTVTWTQQDAGFHTVTSGTADVAASGVVTTHPSGIFDSGKLATGKRFEFRFTKAGAYRYFCQIHPATMHGVVAVT
jgi:plastocyanin